MRGQAVSWGNSRSWVREILKAGKWQLKRASVVERDKGRGWEGSSGLGEGWRSLRESVEWFGEFWLEKWSENCLEDFSETSSQMS
jgi:hypothetical protein